MFRSYSDTIFFSPLVSIKCRDFGPNLPSFWNNTLRGKEIFETRFKCVKRVWWRGRENTRIGEGMEKRGEHLTENLKLSWFDFAHAFRSHTNLEAEIKDDEKQSLHEEPADTPLSPPYNSPRPFFRPFYARSNSNSPIDRNVSDLAV